MVLSLLLSLPHVCLSIQSVSQSFIRSVSSATLCSVHPFSSQLTPAFTNLWVSRLGVLFLTSTRRSSDRFVVNKSCKCFYLCNKSAFGSNFHIPPVHVIYCKSAACLKTIRAHTYFQASETCFSHHSIKDNKWSIVLTVTWNLSENQAKFLLSLYKRKKKLHQKHALKLIVNKQNKCFSFQ